MWERCRSLLPDLPILFYYFKGSWVVVEQDPGHPFRQMLRGGKRTIPGHVVDCPVLWQESSYHEWQPGTYLFTGLCLLSRTQWIKGVFWRAWIQIWWGWETLSCWYARFQPSLDSQALRPCWGPSSQVSKPSWGWRTPFNTMHFYLRMCDLCGRWPYFRSPCFPFPLYRTTICFSACLRRLAHWQVSKPLGSRDSSTRGK